MDYLKNMTVKELREIAKRMGPKAPISGLRKAELVSVISKWIELDHAKALKMDDEAEKKNSTPEAEYIVPGTDVVIRGIHAELMIRHEGRVRRYNPTMKRRNDGKVILTAKQRRRVQKKMKTDWKRTVGAF